MNYSQKVSNKREMLGCAREARYESKANNPQKAQEWNAKAAERLFKLNGMAGSW